MDIQLKIGRILEVIGSDDVEYAIFGNGEAFEKALELKQKIREHCGDVVHVGSVASGAIIAKFSELVDVLEKLGVPVPLEAPLHTETISDQDFPPPLVEQNYVL